MNNNVKIYVGFPGVGKSTMAIGNNRIIDLDIPSRNPDTLIQMSITEHKDLYRKEIKRILLQDAVDILLLTSHNSVREVLIEEGLLYTLVYPERHLKEDYISKYNDRHTSSGIIEILDNNWDIFIDSMIDDKNAMDHIILSYGEYLSDKI